MTAVPWRQRPCPICHAPTGPHCPSPGAVCPWRKCRREACRAVINYRRRGVVTGFQVLPGGVVRPFRLPEPLDEAA